MDTLLGYLVIVQILVVIYMKEFNFFLLVLILLPLIYLSVHKKWKILFTCIITICITVAICFIQNNLLNSPKTKPSLNYQGKILSTPAIDGNKISFNYKLHNQEVFVVSYADTENDLSNFKKRDLADRCHLKGELSRPNPNSNPYLFNYKQYLLNQHIQWILTADVKSTNSCSTGKRTILETLLFSRKALTGYVENHFTDQTVGYINALLFGDRSKMDIQTESQYQLVGIVHLLAISGSHISLISLAAYYFLIRIGITKETSLYTTIIIIIYYGFLAGASASVVRAVVIGVLVCIVKLMKKKVSITSLLFISCILMIAAKPSYVDDVGFQFSFLASFVLILTSKKLLQINSWLGKALFTSCTTQLASLPILLVNFHEFSPYSMLVNLIFVPFISFIVMPLCIFGFLLSFISSTLHNCVEAILSFCIYWSSKFLTLCLHLPFVKLTFIHPSRTVLIFYFLSIFFFFYSLEIEKIKHQLKYSIIAVFVLIIAHYFYPYFNPVGKIMFIDIGQGDCTLIKLPYNKGNYLIDTGGKVIMNKAKWMERKKTFSTGSDIVIPVLKGEGISKLDKLIFTHGDFDHIGGGKEILQTFKVKTLFVGDKVKYKATEQERIDIAKENGVNVKKISEGYNWQTNGSTFQVINPKKNYSGDENHGSIVIRAYIGGKSWLFTGDFDSSGEQRVLSDYPNLKTDILKVGHHGSDTSSSEEFIKAVNPELAIISVGKKNRYGHPKKEVVDRLNRYKVKILRTDENGAITYEFKNGQGTFYTFQAYGKARENKKAYKK